MQSQHPLPPRTLQGPCTENQFDCKNDCFTALIVMSAHRTKPRSKSGRNGREQGLATPPATSPVFAAYSEEELQGKSSSQVQILSTVSYLRIIAAQALLKIRYGCPIAWALAQEARDLNIDQSLSSAGLSTHQALPRESYGHLSSSPSPLVQGRSSSPTSVEHAPPSPRKSSPVGGLKSRPMMGTFSTLIRPLKPSSRASKSVTAPDLKLSYTPLDQLRDSGSSPYARGVRSVAQLRSDPFPQGIFPSQAVVTGTESDARQAFIEGNNSALGGGNVIAAVQREGPGVTLSRGIFPSQEVMSNNWPGVRQDFQETESSFSGGHVFAALRERGTIFEHSENKAGVAALRRRIERESSNNAWYRARRRDTGDESEDEELDWGSDDEVIGR